MNEDRRLPIDEVLPELREALRRNGAVVLHAPPGAGKTTRVPLALLDLFPAGRIVMLEPRRLAAVSAARWMAGCLGEEAGATVGYTIRFESRTSLSTRIEVVTEGVLTRRIQSDPGLDGVALIIFDEFHERSIHADLALALALDIRRNLRDDLKLLVMSATLECGPIAELLGGAPVITATGRSFPVAEHYLDRRRDAPLPESVSGAVRKALAGTDGDLLVFLPGAGEIRSCAKALAPIAGGAQQEISLHPLYGDLPFDEQQKAILPSRRRKIVLATNIAETSLTIEGVHTVIDSGLTRRLQFDPSSGMNRLVTVSVSKAAAEQRKGRAGRLGPGTCYRLYSRHEYRSFLDFASPEILVSDLSSLLLELAVWGVKEPSALSWLDTPPEAAVESGRRLLRELGAIDASGAVTSLGRAMARLPLHPRLSRMLIRSGELGCTRLGADLAALISERDIIRSRPGGPDPDLGLRLDLVARQGQTHDEGITADLSGIRQVGRVARQLRQLMQRDGGRDDGGMEHDAAAGRLLLSAFPDRVAQLREGEIGRFVLMQGRGVRVSQQSCLASSRYLVCVNVDAGDRAEGTVRLAYPVDEELVREECAAAIESVRSVGWDRRSGGVVARTVELLGSIQLASRPFNPSDEESVAVVCEAIRNEPGLLVFGPAARRLQGRVRLIREAYPEEEWPDISDEALIRAPEEWLAQFLAGVRTGRDISRIDLEPALRSRLSWKQAQLLDARAPGAIIVPSGHRVPIDYDAGDIPVLAVKLQEMFGLGDTPAIAEGRVKLLLHLLSPARRPVQVTQDLKGFWNQGYAQVRKELRGRYPKHPWPDDPWNAAPTRRAKQRGG